VKTSCQRSQPIRIKRVRLFSWQRAHRGTEVVDVARADTSDGFQGVPTQATDGGTVATHRKGPLAQTHWNSEGVDASFGVEGLCVAARGNRKVSIVFKECDDKD